MEDAQARKEATMRRINGLKTSLARIVSSSSYSDREAPRPFHVVSGSSVRHTDPQTAVGAVQSPERTPSHMNALRSLSPQMDPLAYLDHAQQEVERLTVERNQLVRTCANQERQLQLLQANQNSTVAVRGPHDAQDTIMAADALVEAIQHCYPALLRTTGSHEQVDPHLALTRLARILPSLVAGSTLGDALSVAGADLLERVGSLQDEVEVDHFKLLDLVDQLTAANDGLKQEAVAREAELHRLRSTADQLAVHEALIAAKKAAEEQAAQANSQLVTANIRLRDLAEQLSQQQTLTATQELSLQKAKDEAEETNKALSNQRTEAQSAAQQWQARLQDAEERAQETIAHESQRAAALENELASAREACRASDAKAQLLQEENEALVKQLTTRRESSVSTLNASLAVDQAGDDSVADASAVDDSQADLSVSSVGDKRAARRRASELVAAKRKTEQFRRHSEELEQRLQEAEVRVRELTAELERERMSAAPRSAKTDEQGDGEFAGGPPAVRRQENALLINFAAVAQGAEETATSEGPHTNTEHLLYPPGVDVADWLDTLVAPTDFAAWAQKSLSPEDLDAVSATGALYHVGLAVTAAADVWAGSESERTAVARLMLQVQRFVDHPDGRLDTDEVDASVARRRENKTVDALRFCHVCTQQLHRVYSGDDETSVEARMALFIAAACQFIYTDGHRTTTPDASTAARLVAHERWERVEALIEHVHRHDDAYPLFASEAAFERVTAAVRALLHFTTSSVALALELAFFPEDGASGNADALASHRHSVGQGILLLSQNACLFRTDPDHNDESVLLASTTPLTCALDRSDVKSLNSSLMGVVYSPTDALLAHIDGVVLPLALALGRIAPALKPVMLSVLTCRRSLPFDQNRQWHVPSAVLDPLVGAVLEADSRASVVPVATSSFVSANRELARLYRENAALRKTMLRVVTAAESFRIVDSQDGA